MPHEKKKYKVNQFLYILEDFLYKGTKRKKLEMVLLYFFVSKYTLFYRTETEN